MFLVLLGVGCALFRGGISYLESSSVVSPLDELYPDERAAGRRMDRVLGSICLAMGAIIIGSALVLILR